MSPYLALLCSQVRAEEKLLLAACDQRGIEMEILDDRKLVWSAAGTLLQPLTGYDVVLIRSISHSRARHTLHYFRQIGSSTVNTLEVATICGDKLRSTSALSQAGVPSPMTRIA